METFSIDKHYSKIKISKLSPTRFSIGSKIGYKIEEGVSLSGLDKLIPDCQLLMIDTLMIKRNMLSILKLPQLDTLLMSNVYNFSPQGNKSAVVQVVNIIKKHLKDKDVVSCAEELIEKGFKDYARL